MELPPKAPPGDEDQYLKNKRPEWSFYGQVFRWTFLFCVLTLTLALAYSWIK